MNFSHPKHIPIEEYNYPLPESRIALHPLAERDASKLLLFRNNEISEDVFSSLPQHLPKDSLLIFNNTKVIQARLIFQKNTGANIEIFCLDPASPSDYNLTFSANGTLYVALSCRQFEKVERWHTYPNNSL